MKLSVTLAELQAKAVPSPWRLPPYSVESLQPEDSGSFSQGKEKRLPRTRLLLTVDGLAASYLGPYGGSWLPTPAFNRLASRATVFDCVMVASMDSAANLEAVGCFDESFFAAYREAGWRTVLIHDEGPWLDQRAAADHIVPIGEPIAADASESESAESEPTAPSTGGASASSLAETRMGTLTGAALTELNRAEDDLLMWVHCSCLTQLWDAPFELVLSLIDEEDPEPQRLAEPPCRMVADDEDPDILLGIRQVYAAQIAVLDDCLGLLFEHPRLDAGTGESECDFAILGLRGYPLGEHRHIGFSESTPLFSELLSVPAIVGCGQESRQRWSGLLTLADLRPLLECPLPSTGRAQPTVATLPRRDRLEIQWGDECVTRTPQWYLRRVEEGTQLYAKPDDRFERNDVADIMGDVVDHLTELSGGGESVQS